MKLKSMYSCVLRKPLAGDALKSDEAKPRRSDKTNKKNTFKPKWQKPAKTSDSTPPKSLFIEDNFSSDKLAEKCSSDSSPPIAYRQPSPELPSPLKPTNASQPLISKTDAERRCSPDNFESRSAYSNPAASFTNEVGDQALNCRYDQVASDELTLNNDTFETNWQTTFTDICDKNSVSYTDEVAQAFKKATLFDHVTRPSSNQSETHFEDLQNQMMKKYGFVGLNGAVSFDTTKNQSAKTNTSDLPRPHSGPIRPRTLTDGEQSSADRAGAPAKRASSMNQPTKSRDHPGDIPPIVPPREPVRSSRISPPLRSCSTPSPTSSFVHSTSTPSTHFSPAVSENNRPKFHVQPSTTAVFSAMPSGLSSSQPIILPIMKDGKQESHTHYFLLGDEKAAAKHLKQQSSKVELNAVARPTPSAFVPPFNRNSCPPPQRPPPPSNTRFNSLQNFAAAANKNPNLLSTYPPRRNPTSSTSSNEERIQTRYNDMGRGQKVVLLQSQVFGVTDEECQQALRSHAWDVPNSIKYLKVEQLYQMGVLPNKEECERALQNADWNLESASRILLERHNRGNRS